MCFVYFHLRRFNVSHSLLQDLSQEWRWLNSPVKSLCGTGSRGSLVSVRLDPTANRPRANRQSSSSRWTSWWSETLQSSFTPPALRFSYSLFLSSGTHSRVQPPPPDQSHQQRVRPRQVQEVWGGEHNICDHKTSHKAQLRFIHNIKAE